MPESSACWQPVCHEFRWKLPLFALGSAPVGNVWYAAQAACSTVGGGGEGGGGEGGSEGGGEGGGGEGGGEGGGGEGR